MRSELDNSVSASGINVAILVSMYHEEITTKLADGAASAFQHAGGNAQDCITIPVAGSWELPIVAKALAISDDLDAIVALGCIIEGETTHNQVIGAAIAQGLMHVALEWNHPVSMGVLTCRTIEQAAARAGGECGNKGIEAMHAAINTVALMKRKNH